MRSGSSNRVVGMEQAEFEEKTTKNIYDKIGLTIFFIAGSLLGISTTYIFDTYQLTGVALSWVALAFAYIIYDDFRVRAECKKIESDDAGKRRIRELFLKQLMEPRVIYGNDILIRSDGKNNFSSNFDAVTDIEILAFSQKKFDFVLFTDENFDKFRALDETHGDSVLGLDDLRKLGISCEVCSDHNTFIKTIYRTMPNQRYVFYFARPEKSDEEDFEINFTISKTQQGPIARKNSPEKEKERP